MTRRAVPCPDCKRNESLRPFFAVCQPCLVNRVAATSGEPVAKVRKIVAIAVEIARGLNGKAAAKGAGR